jgi:hypothetical protein
MVSEQAATFNSIGFAPCITLLTCGVRHVRPSSLLHMMRQFCHTHENKYALYCMCSDDGDSDD